MLPLPFPKPAGSLGGGSFIVMTRIQLQHNYNSIISIENLLEAWKEFVRGKKSRKDVQEFERNLMGNIISLHRDLATKTYAHSAYQHFKIADPKPRDIHKASVRDRLLHHAIHRKLSPFFFKTFIAESYSCQNGKGTHRALHQFKKFIDSVSENNTKTVWVLKCDIKKFFANIDQAVLLEMLVNYIPDHDIVWLVSIIIGSFNSGVSGVGLPLMNTLVESSTRAISQVMILLLVVDSILIWLLFMVYQVDIGQMLQIQVVQIGRQTRVALAI